MTARQLNAMVSKYNGYAKTDTDFYMMLRELQRAGLLLSNTVNEYNETMTRKDYSYCLYESVVDEYGQVVEGKVVGYLSVIKCWRTTDLEQPFEILAYVS